MPPTKRPTKTPNSSEPLQAILPWILLTEVYLMASPLLDQRLSTLGVTVEQARFLAVLAAAKEPMPIDVLLSQLQRPSQAGAGIVERLERDGRARRVSDPRGWRGVGLELTASGRKLAATVKAISQELDDLFFGPALTPTARRKLQEILTKVRAAALALPDADHSALWQD